MRKIQDFSRNDILDLTEFFCRSEWRQVVELLQARREGKVRDLITGTDQDERNRGRIEEIDFLIGLKDKLVNQKILVDTSELNDIT